MLLEELVKYCSSLYLSTRCNNSFCTHPNECPNSCEICLEQVHYPLKYTNGRLDYNCKRLLYFYVCKYTQKYESEIEYAFCSLSKLQNHNGYNILSLGCGATPDLIAIEQYNMLHGYNKPVCYWGIDLNKHWKPIHEMIQKYANAHSYGIKFIYDDVTTLFNHICYKNFNILVLQYLISFFYNNSGIFVIDTFYDDLIENVIKYMLPQSVIIINDVNSNRRGRDYFMLLSEKLTAKGIKNVPHQRYFNYNIRNTYMCYGEVYPNNIIKHDVSLNITSYNPWEICSSAQLIIELE